MYVGRIITKKRNFRNRKFAHSTISPKRSMHVDRKKQRPPGQGKPLLS
jgi:hypothetical protein